MCMRATIVYIYLCDCIVIFECEAHFNMIIVPASVCVWGGGSRGDGGLYLVHSQVEFWGGGLGWTVTLQVPQSLWGSVQSQCRPEPGVAPWWWGGYLMICGQSLQALAFRLARASQAGSVDCGESLEGKRFDTSLTAGGDGVESAISTETRARK